MFAPSEFLELAKALHTQATVESYARSSVSRAYYSAFLTAKQKGRVVATKKDDNIHALVFDYCSSYLPLMANDLKDLRLRRNKADYNLDIVFSAKDSDWAIRTAEGIIYDLR